MKFTEILSDVTWAITAMRARRARRRMYFGSRIRFDDAFRPRLTEGDVIAYPDAFYHTKREDFSRAIAKSK